MPTLKTYQNLTAKPLINVHMEETLKGIIVLFSIVIFLPTFAFMIGVSYGDKSRNAIIGRYKKALEVARFRIAELADGLGGKCGFCKGYGVLGEDGSSDCWDCGGTGLRSLSEYKVSAQSILAKAERECTNTLEKIKEIRTTLSNP